MDTLDPAIMFTRPVTVLTVITQTGTSFISTNFYCLHTILRGLPRHPANVTIAWVTGRVSLSKFEQCNSKYGMTVVRNRSLTSTLHNMLVAMRKHNRGRFQVVEVIRTISNLQHIHNQLMS